MLINWPEVKFSTRQDNDHQKSFTNTWNFLFLCIFVTRQKGRSIYKFLAECESIWVLNIRVYFIKRSYKLYDSCRVFCIILKLSPLPYKRVPKATYFIQIIREFFFWFFAHFTFSKHRSIIFHLDWLIIVKNRCLIHGEISSRISTFFLFLIYWGVQCNNLKITFYNIPNFIFRSCAASWCWPLPIFINQH